MNEYQVPGTKYQVSRATRLRSLLLGGAVLALLAAAPAAAQSHLLVVSGLGGEPRLSDQFHRWGASLVDAARTRFGLRPEQVVWLAEAPERDPARIRGRSTREEVERALRELAGRAGPADRVLIVLLGHGSSGPEGGRISLPGPDLGAAELARLLGAFATQPVVVVNAASASGDFQAPLAGRNRAVITATRSGMERNETVFGRFFVDALAGQGADTDKDGRVSMLEAFQYASAEVERFYKSDNRLQTEHPTLGGSRELAGAFHLSAGPSGGATPAASAELRALLAEKQRLEEGVEALRARKEGMDAAAYQRELEQLLLQLARKNREIREKGGGG